MKERTIRDKKRRIRRKPAPVDLRAILRPPVRPAIPPAQQRPTTRLTPYAERLLARSKESTPQAPPLAPSSDWITTCAAAKLTGYCRRHITTLCQQGFFIEGKEWRQRPARPGSTRLGRILVRQSALTKIEGEQ